MRALGVVSCVVCMCGPHAAAVASLYRVGAACCEACGAVVVLSSPAARAARALVTPSARTAHPLQRRDRKAMCACARCGAGEGTRTGGVTRLAALHVPCARDAGDALAAGWHYSCKRRAACRCTAPSLVTHMM